MLGRGKTVADERKEEGVNARDHDDLLPRRE
jgi:hypothetical protein